MKSSPPDNSGQAGFDQRDFRRALGQFATGVTVVTTRAQDGRLVGLTVNSFTSLSLEPPLILWNLDCKARSLPDFSAASHFGVNVLAADQLDLCRRFATPLPDKFEGIKYAEGIAGVPLLEGVVARFICRNLKQYQGGDHVIFIGQVEDYQWSEGEPLLFHAGRYRKATRHPAFPE